MPALLAYLLAIGIFIGGGYAGLVWLTSPPSAPPAIHDAPSRAQHAEPASKSKLRSPEFAGRERDDAPSSQVSSVDRPPPQAGLAEASGPEISKQRDVEGTEPVGTRPGAAQPSAVAQNSAQPSSAPAPSTDPARSSAGEVPAGGCMPIGMTAQGELVFPLQCREILERHRGPTPPAESRPSEGTQASSGQRAATEPHVETGRNPDSADATKSRPSPSAKPEEARASAREAQAQRDTDETPSTGQNGNSMRKARQATRKMSSVRQDQRVPEPSPSRTVVSQSEEWFNPLGLR